MRDKEAPGDTYNYKEHVYADPVALNLRKEQENDVEAESSKAGNVKKYQKPSSPPPVPGGPRQARGPGGSSSLYAELPKKTNVPRVSVRDLGSRFGGTVQQRASRAESSTSVSDEPPPPPLPEVTDSRNILDDSPPGSPAKISNTDGQLVPNISNDENDGNSAPGGEVVKRSASESSGAVAGETLASPSPEEASPDGLANSLQEQGQAPSPIDPNEVVIDVRINSEAGIEIGAELPVASSTTGPDGETDDENGDGIRLIKSIKHDPFAVEDRSKTGEPAPGEPATQPAGSTKQQERNSDTSSASGSVKRKKKKDVESGMNIDGHLRRNLIIASLFLLIILIIVSGVVILLLKYPDVL